MTKLLLTVLVFGALLAGCSEPLPGTTRYLGVVDYDRALLEARQTLLANDFSIESVDERRGVVQARPKVVADQPDRALGQSPARLVAQLRVTREDGQVVGFASVAQQHQQQAVLAASPTPLENYDSVPNQTPAEMEAATTPQQNEAWMTRRYDRDLERALLADLFARLNPSQPTTGPASVPAAQIDE